MMKRVVSVLVGLGLLVSFNLVGCSSSDGDTDLDVVGTYYRGTSPTGDEDEYLTLTAAGTFSGNVWGEARGGDYFFDEDNQIVTLVFDDDDSEEIWIVIVIVIVGESKVSAMVSPDMNQFTKL